MSTPTLSAPPRQPQEALSLRALYDRYKALAISAGASLAAQRRPLEMRGAVNALQEDCTRAGESAPTELAAAFDACQTAAQLLAAMLTEAETGLRAPSPQAIRAVRESHRQLRQLVWQFCECEYVPCAAHRDPRPRARPTAN